VTAGADSYVAIGAALVAYGDASAAASFLQTVDGDHVSTGSLLRTHADLAHFEVVNLVRKLAKQFKSAELAQLAGRLSTAVKEARMGLSSGQDPFAKVKQMIGDMLVKLEQDASTDAKHKEYCDKEMAETKTKLGELHYDIEKLSGKIDKATSESATLKEEVATLSKEIADITKSQASADAYRREEHAAYKETKVDLQQGLEGIRMALKVLREYFANSGAAAASALMQQPGVPETHAKSSGAGSGIIGMLEVVESDLSKSLASTEMAEENAAVAYERVGMENRVSLSMKKKDVEYKGASAVKNDKAVVELSSDRDSAQTELDAVLEYSANIRGMCEVKPESYEDRKNRREQEVAGLKEALQILEGQAVLVQKKSVVARAHVHAGLRGAVA